MFKLSKLAMTMFLLMLPLPVLFAPVARAQQAPAVVGFVINEDGSSISILDPATGNILTTHALPLNGKGAQLAAYTAQTNSQSSSSCDMDSAASMDMEYMDMTGVHAMQVSTPAATPVVTTVLNKPHLAAYDPVSHRLYVGNKGSNFVVLDMSNVMAPRVIANVKPGGSGEIHRVVLADGLVWLAHQGDSAVYAYDMNSNDFSTPLVKLSKEQGFDTTHGLTRRPGTDEIWATNRPTNAPGTVTRIDARARQVIGQPLQVTGKAGDRPNNIEFSPDGKWAYVANTGTKATQVTVIDAEKFEVVKQIEQDATVGVSPHALSYDAVTGRLFVVNMTSGTLTAIRPRDNFILGYFSIGAEAHGVTIGPDGLVYATAKRDNKIVVMDSQRLTVVRVITDPAMKGPHAIFFTAPAPQPQPSATATTAAPTAAPTDTPVPVIAAAEPPTATSVPAALPAQVAAPVAPQPSQGQTPGMPRTGQGDNLGAPWIVIAAALVLLTGTGLRLARAVRTVKK